jgi:hypothetical protein
MLAHAPLPLLAALFLLAQTEATAQDTTKQPTAEDVAKAEKAVKEQLEKYKAAHGQVKQVKDETVTKAFPRYTFFAVLYRQFPVGRVVPKPLKPANLFAVSRDGKPELINDNKALEKFFAAHLAPCKEQEQITAAVRAWLTLAPELRQDGFFAFQVDKTIETNLNKKGGGDAEGKAVVMRGGNGALTAKLVFNEDGKLTKIEEKSTIRPGPRPICQATKLLDKDPIVRRMAEQDLLYLGRLARPYLDEQRAKATPELRRAIDRLWQRILEEDQ